jgi:hypothetical protein
VSKDKPNALTRSPFQAQAETGGDLARLPREMDRPLNDPLESFFAACGGVQTISLAVRRIEGRGSAETYGFQQPFVVIGCCQDCDLVMPDKSVNYRHVYLQLVAGRWFFANLARISRTRAGQGHLPSGPFDVGCELKVGSHVIKRVGMAPVELIRQTAASPSESSPELPSFTLESVSRRRGSSDLPPQEFNAPVTLLGTSKRCHLVMEEDASVSRVHASLVLTPDGLFVVDLVGRGGVTVDGRREIWSQVHDGTVLQIGRASLRVRTGAPRPKPIGRLGRRAASMELTPDYSAQAPAAVVYGGLSEGAVLALVNQMAEMQNQFFEHSRMQMQWMSQMLAQVSQAQQESARRDFARIEEITSELRAIRAQLAQTADSPSASKSDDPESVGGVEQGSPHAAADQLLIEAEDQLPRSTGGDQPPPNRDLLEDKGQTPRPRSVSEKETETSVPTALPAPSGTESEAPVPPKPATDVATPYASRIVAQAASHARVNNKRTGTPRSPVDSHVLLTERMARLSQEQNSLWRRLMNTLSGK